MHVDRKGISQGSSYSRNCSYELPLMKSRLSKSKKYRVETTRFDTDTTLRWEYDSADFDIDPQGTQGNLEKLTFLY